MAEFEFSVSTGYVGSEKREVITIEDEDLEGRTEEEQAKILDETFNEWMWENIYTGIKRL